MVIQGGWGWTGSKFEWCPSHSVSVSVSDMGHTPPTAFISVFSGFLNGSASINLTAAQCRELAAALRNVADEIERKATP